MSNFLEQLPHFNNLHTRTQALGMARCEERIYYLSTAGPGTACKSIWSSLVSPRSSIDCQPWGDHLSGMSELTTLYQALPNSHYQHMVSLHKRTNFVLCAAAEAAAWHDECEIDAVEARRQRLAQSMAAVHKRFVVYLNAESNVPVLADWAGELWQVGLAGGGITPLDCFGDCLGAWLIEEQFDWLSAVQSLLRHGHIRFPLRTVESQSLAMLSLPTTATITAVSVPITPADFVLA